MCVCVCVCVCVDYSNLVTANNPKVESIPINHFKTILILLEMSNFHDNIRDIFKANQVPCRALG